MLSLCQTATVLTRSSYDYKKEVRIRKASTQQSHSATKTNDIFNSDSHGQGSHDYDHCDRDVQSQEAAPLADRLRPKTVEEVVGQDHLTTGPDALLGFGSDASVTTENIIFWGPPG